MSILSELKKEKEFLVCADSDGCVMDVMDAKHEKCFAPCFIESFDLNHRCTEAYETWLKVNLFSRTRGINRFKACLLTLKALKVEVEGLEVFEDFCNNSPELSNRAIEELLKTNDNPCMRTVLQMALEHEWEKHNFTGFVHGLLSQEEGSKAFCINGLLEKGYDKDKVVMIGDAPGDIKAAEDNGVWCYPIIVGKEAQSWKRFKDEVLPALVEGKLTKELLA